LSGKWRYRVGDYRVLCEIRDSELIVLAIEVGHRRDIYR
jgi:mRNA interferase RelE/StbE